MFKAKKNQIVIECEKEKFVLDPIKASCAFADMASVLDEYRKSFLDFPTDETISEITADFKKQLDSLLGSDGACEQFLSVEEINFYNLSDLFFYIKGELNKFNAEKRKEWSRSGNAQSSDR